jgi:hypothetical protein
MPAVTEPLVVWISSGEAEAQERESNGPWVTSRLKKGSLFLTAAGAPYDFRWRTLTPEPFEVVLVLLSVPLFNEALQDVFGVNAEHARLRDVSGFEDQHLVQLLQQLREDAKRPAASHLLVRGVGQTAPENRCEAGPSKGPVTPDSAGLLRLKADRDRSRPQAPDAARAGAAAGLPFGKNADFESPPSPEGCSGGHFVGSGDAPETFKNSAKCKV